MVAALKRMNDALMGSGLTGLAITAGIPSLRPACPIFILEIAISAYLLRRLRRAQ
jgi:hypothetical protein